MKSEQWAWWSYEEERHMFIFPTVQQVEICSPDFFKSAIAKGEGKIVRVLVQDCIDGVSNAREMT